VSGNRKRQLALLFGVMASAFVGLGWGVILRLLGEPLVECVKDGGAAGGGTFVASLAVILLFPFQDDPGMGMPVPSTPAPPRAPAA
jgi:hypothetical protein